MQRYSIRERGEVRKRPDIVRCGTAGSKEVAQKVHVNDQEPQNEASEPVHGEKADGGWQQDRREEAVQQ
jgi:hypothetical protein